MKNNHTLGKQNVAKISFWRNKMSNRKALLSRGKIQLLLISLAMITLFACDKVSNEEARPEVAARSAPAANVEVGYFKDNFYDQIINLSCNNCHVRGGLGTGAFADANVNTAFAAASSMLSNSLSELTTANAPNARNEVLANKIFDNSVTPPTTHNCWTADCAADADTMAGWIMAWADVANGGETADEESARNNPDQPTTLTLTAPPIAEPVNSKVLDESRPAEFTALWNIFRGTGPDDVRCSGCHDSNTTTNTPQTPFFADSDINAAYGAVIGSGVVDLNVDQATPISSQSNSRVVYRVGAQSHNCWSNDCASDATAIMAAITSWSDSITDVPAFDPTGYVLSKALNMDDGQVTSGGARVNQFVIAKYEFKDGADNPSLREATDTSGVGAPINLSLFGDVTWIRSYGLRFGPGGYARSTSIQATRKLHDRIVARGEYSIEAWVLPANLTQMGDGGSFEAAPIASYSIGETNRNFTLAQYNADYRFYNRNNPLEPAGEPALEAVEVLQASLQHVVMTYSEEYGRRIFVNGVPVLCDIEIPAAQAADFPAPCGATAPMEQLGDMSNLVEWDLQNLLTVGADTEGSNQWLGDLKFLAIHNKALNQAQIDQNYAAGVGQKFNLLFNITENLGATISATNPGYYVWFKVSEYDDYSYLFSEPQFIALNVTTTDTVDFTFSGMRIGMNGKEVEVGQGFDNYGKPTPIRVQTNEEANDDIPDSAEPVPLWTAPVAGSTAKVPSRVSGTVFAQEQGRLYDQFYLTFETINGNAEDPANRTPVVMLPPPVAYQPTNDSFTVGLRTFAEINATMAQLTQVNNGATVINDTYLSLKEAMPAQENISGFLPSQQIAIAGLAGLYCDHRVEGTNLVGGADSSEVYFNTAGIQANFFGSNVSTWTGGTPADATVTNNNITTIATAIVNNMVNDMPNIDKPAITAEVVTLGNFMMGFGTHPLEPGTAAPGCRNPVPSTGVAQDCTGPARTKAIVKAMCTSVLGSAVVTHQ